MPSWSSRRSSQGTPPVGPWPAEARPWLPDPSRRRIPVRLFVGAACLVTALVLLVLPGVR